ncbi:hypothetical protein [Komagataeibacter xylinus]|uniref:hypothetical protein n=1 Tax=Komagataeibacter xylinus TaxID=28448 RepID=UPI000FDF8144|nr:hypothetical protein [Komagataeibacter xylinus]AZV39800.1 hypothetical protein CXP35_14510 [Komagataeibacter xylinus]
MNETDRLTIIPVSGFRQMTTFIQLPRHLYAGLPGYVPPLDLTQRDLLTPRKNSFFRNGRAQYFLAMRGGRAVGRISAQIDPVSMEHYGEPIGFFGAFDAIDDLEVVSALLDAAGTWLRQRGMKTMRGPQTLDSNGEFGLMLEGHHALPMVAMPWHPKWLPGMMDACGCTKVRDLVAYQMHTGPDAEDAHLVPASLRLGEGRLGNVTTRGLRMDRIKEDGEILRALYNDAWRNNWGSIPLAREDIESMIVEMKPLLKPEHFVLIEQAGKPVCVALVVPNVFDISADLNGAPSPLGWLKLGKRLLRHEFHSARVILLGVSSVLDGTALGAIMPALAITELMKRGRSLPYRTIELGWVLETNTSMRRLIERITPEPCKRYRVYDRPLEE